MANRIKDKEGKGYVQTAMSGSRNDKAKKFLLGYSQTKRCQYCGHEDQTNEHLLYDCPHYDDTRGKAAPNIPKT